MRDDGHNPEKLCSELGLYDAGAEHSVMSEAVSRGIIHKSMLTSCEILNPEFIKSLREDPRMPSYMSLSALDQVLDRIASAPQSLLIARDGNGRSLLHAAADECSRPVIEALVARGCIGDAPDSINGTTPLHQAFDSDPDPRALAFLQAPININVRNYVPCGGGARHVLFWCSADSPKNLGILEQFVTAGLSLDQDEGTGETAILHLCSAVKFPRDLELWRKELRLFRDHGASLDVYSAKKTTDLIGRIFAAGNARLTNLLSQRDLHPDLPGTLYPPLNGLDVNEPNMPPPPHQIPPPGQFEIGRIVSQVSGLRAAGPQGSWLPEQLALIARTKEEIDQAIKRGHSILERNSALETALHWAADDCPRQIIRHLLENGAWPDLGDRDGNTALHRAIQGVNFSGFEEMLDFAESRIIFFNNRICYSQCFHYRAVNNPGDSVLACLARANPPTNLWLDLFRRLRKFVDRDWRETAIFCLRDIARSAGSALSPSEADALDAARAQIVEYMINDPSDIPSCLLPADNASRIKMSTEDFTRTSVYAQGQSLMDFIRQSGNSDLKALL